MTLEKLRMLAKRDILPEDADIQDWCGGNFDDAYSLGLKDGRTELAGEVLELVKELEEYRNHYLERIH
jgi:hypothetical protein